MDFTTIELTKAALYLKLGRNIHTIFNRRVKLAMFHVLEFKREEAQEEDALITPPRPTRNDAPPAIELLDGEPIVRVEGALGRVPRRLFCQAPSTPEQRGHIRLHPGARNGARKLGF